MGKIPGFFTIGVPNRADHWYLPSGETRQFPWNCCILRFGLDHTCSSFPEAGSGVLCNPW